MEAMRKRFLAARYGVVLFALTVFALSIVPAAMAKDGLLLGVHPYLQASEILARFTPLAEHMEKELGRPVSIEIAGTYQEHIDRCGAGRLDIAFLGPASYVKLTKAYGKRPILGAVEVNGRQTFHGVIIVRQDSPLRGLRDLKGRTFAFGDPNSTMAHLVPRSLLLQAGVGPNDLAGSKHLSNHDNIALGVLAGDFDAGAVKQDIYERYRDRGLRTLAVTPEIADHLFVACSALPHATIKAARAALLGLGNEPGGSAILRTLRSDVTGVVMVRDSDYDPLRRIIDGLKQVGIEP